MKDIRSVNNYGYEEADIAKSLQRAMSQGADPVTVKYLNDERNKKIEAGGAATAQYKNDAVARGAQAYVDSFAKTNTDKLAEARRKTQAQGLKQAYDSAKQTYQAGVSEAEQTSANERRLYLADAQKKQLDTEAALARLGLGRGVSEGASSGFGESARAMLLSDAAEGLTEIYEKERAAKNELAIQRDESVRAANEQHIENIDESYSQQAEDRLSADKNYNDMRKAVMEMSQQRQKDDRDFEYKKATDEFDHALELFDKTGVVENEAQAQVLHLPVGTSTESAKELAFEIDMAERSFDSEQDSQAYEQALKSFEAAGVVANENMAQILGLPVGTTLWQYVTDRLKASASMRSADASMLNANANMTGVGVDNMRAENDAYANETDRLTAYRLWLNDELERKKDAKQYGLYD